MYLYIFGPLRWLRLCAYVGAAITTAFYTGMTVASFVIASPRPGETWAEHLYGKEIRKSIDLPIPTSSFGVVIDLVILVLPITAVMQLQLPTRRKIGVILVFMTGSLYDVAEFAGSTMLIGPGRVFSPSSTFRSVI